MRCLAVTLAVAVVGCATGVPAGPSDAGATVTDGGPTPGDALTRDGQVDGPPAMDRPAFDALPQRDSAPTDTALQLDATTHSDAGPQQDASSGCHAVDLLTNGGFDQGATAWAESSAGGFGLIFPDGDLPQTPHAGTHAAWLGGYDGASDVLRQLVTVPAGTTELQAAGQFWIETTEGSSTPYDIVTVELWDASDSLLETLIAYSNGDTTVTWTGFSRTTLQPHAGEAVQLVFYATTDIISNPTNFLFDTVTLTATVCN